MGKELDTGVSMIGFVKGEIADFEEAYDRVVEPGSPMLASNIADTKKFSIQTPDIVIKVNPDRTDLIETRMIDGKQCLVITVDDHIEVNGMNVRTIRRESDHEQDL